MLTQLPPLNDSEDLPVALAEVGDTAKAEEILRRELAAHPDDTIWQNVTGPLIRGAIALSRQQPEEAIEALRPAVAYDLRSFDTPDMRGRAYLAARKPEPAAIEFRKIIDHPGVDPMSHYLPLAHLGLARAYAMQGNVAASRGEYEKLFALWRDADADLPAKNDAYLELANLR